MNDVKRVIDDYVSIWNESDPARRRALIEAAWTPDGTYVDPLMAGEGHGGFDDMIQGVQAQYPNHRLERTSAVDTVGDRVRFGWALVNATTETPLAAGVDFGLLGLDGRLRSVTGFLDQVAAQGGGS